jgi:hypothetical protein
LGWHLTLRSALRGKAGLLGRLPRLTLLPALPRGSDATRSGYGLADVVARCFYLLRWE